MTCLQMVQKPLAKLGKSLSRKSEAEKKNRHGKGSTLRKGRVEFKPKKPLLKESLEFEQELSKVINARNETSIAAKALITGGTLHMVRPPPEATKAAEDKKKPKSLKRTILNKK